MDFLARWLLKLQQNDNLLLPFPQILPCLLYADDALLFFKPSTGQAQVLKTIFTLFHSLSGLNVNPSKSQLVFLNTTIDVREACQHILGCIEHFFPITYLGLPLSNKKLHKNDYVALIERFKNTLNTWTSSLLSLAGRLVLINSCLSSLPVYFMSVFQLPRWVIDILNNIRRTYLWQGRNANRKLVTVAWDKVCSPKSIGGLGVSDIYTFNLSLLAKWYWKWHSSDQSCWRELLINLHGNSPTPPINSPLSKSFQQLQPIINTITYFTITSGTFIQLWHQNWGLGILSSNFQVLFSYCLNPDITDYNFLQHLAAPLELFRPSLTSSLLAQQQLHELVHLTQQTLSQPISLTHDQIYCKIAPNQLTSASLYNFLKTFPKIPSDTRLVWKLKVPPRVTTFSWLLLHDKLPTIINLQKKGMTIVNRCCLCKSQAETMLHLFRTCHYSLTTRTITSVLSNCNIPNLDMGIALTSTELTLKQKELLAIYCYYIWKERCSRTFFDANNQPRSTAMLILEDWRLLHPD
ncbi:RNA-directed DNA polymerase (reverse transcriptase)-related family protein [Rhynchospora pubera]|uniref:RNA-directed DNA polymerase (Reverse transcriptase)-related family protein n=1 Tax=Rhynchospora pubera TaxID=906938 RepID=A0AAV8EN90_9POAL|nr:RNA-directed DNA polymerase (reverse transcriptase)-related family protein [Rhynchospora pubera]